jgi:ribosomal protein S18 acetylase RimI-like enzyme
VTVRSATPADLAALLALWRAAGAATTVTDSETALTQLIEHDPGALLVAEADGEVIGSLIAAWDGWRGAFYRLAVEPGRRRRGIATALVRAGEERLVERGAERAAAIVISDEDDAIELWSAVGYERQRDRLRFVRNLG